MVVGCVSGELLFVDTSTYETFATVTHHTTPVIGIIANKFLLYTASEDGRLGMMLMYQLAQSLSRHERKRLGDVSSAKIESADDKE